MLRRCIGIISQGLSFSLVGFLLFINVKSISLRWLVLEVMKALVFSIRTYWGDRSPIALTEKTHEVNVSKIKFRNVKFLDKLFRPEHYPPKLQSCFAPSHV